MITRLLLCTFFALLCGSGCGLIYKQNIQQGNAIEQDDLDELYEGMNRRQVLFVLGTPSVKDPFNQDRWDYVQTFSRRGGAMVERTVTLRFDADTLSEISGRDDPFGASADATSGDPDEVATFTRKEDASPQDISMDSAEEDIMSKQPEIDTIDERSSEDREYQEDMDVLDQTPSDGPMGPDIDG